MNKFLSLLKVILLFMCVWTISLFAIELSKKLNTKNTFTETLLNFIEYNSKKIDTRTRIQKPVEDKQSLFIKNYSQFCYRKGDWDKHVLEPKYTSIEGDEKQQIYIYEKNDININTYGSFNLNMLFGKSEFTKDKYRQSDDDSPTSRVIENGLLFERQLQLHMEGNMGRRLKVYIDHDSDKMVNHYIMKYKAINEEEVIREINAGEIDIKFEGSKYAVYDDTSSKGLGIDLTLKKENLKVKVFGSIIKGETVIETFRGNSSPNNTKLADYQYIKNTYFQLEPYKRYDSLNNAPVSDNDPYNALITFTSSPSNPESYMPGSVDISSVGFELHMDDQNPYNNLNSNALYLDGGYYDKLVRGEDYTINYSTGLIQLLKNISGNSRIYAVYNLNAGNTTSSDPAIRIDVEQYNGKIFVFIKYGYSINEDLDNDFTLDSNEDKNNDNRLNLDIYEIRSFYDIGEKQLLEDNFKISFYKENGIMTKTDYVSLGKYSINYSKGNISFNLREPFRMLYAKSGNIDKADIIYSENQTENTFNSSLYNIKIDYYRKARSFQLKHFNIIPGSARIKVNGRKLSSSLYSIDHTSGFLIFTDPNNPVIISETNIEIKYEFLPPGAQSTSLVTGLRSDYKINRNLNIGGTVLFTRQKGADIIPGIGSEPEQTLILETDSSLHLGERSLKKLINTISGYNAKSIPLEINAYAEYAKSYKKVNTFGKALIDNMESNEEITSISLSEKNWSLSSMPYRVLQGDIEQSERGLLYYKYYKDPSNFDTLQGPSFTPYSISYSKKAGPYNIAIGHIPDSLQSQNSQRSLALNFDFSSGDYIPIITEVLSDAAIDFSGLQYLEIWYRSDGGSGEAELFLDFGSLNEDSDGDNVLDTEDINNNGFLDFDPSANLSEDIGYWFNPSGNSSTKIGSGPGLNRYTTGDGILNTEDINRNGVLDTNEHRIRLPGALTTPFNTSNALTIDISDTTWKKARIYLDKSSSEYSSNTNYYEELLKKVESIRLFLRNRGTASTGTIYIDSIKFISSKWGNIMLDGSPNASPEQFSLTLVDSFNDEDYKANSYMLLAKDNYTALYGEKSDDELFNERETAIEIEYDLFAKEKGSITKRFPALMDIRSYKTLNIWFNFRHFTNGDVISIIIGSSETDYYEYRFPMEYQSIWIEKRLNLFENSNSGIDKYSISGAPDMKRISYVRIEVFSQNSGKFWVNDIYLSDPKTQKDTAYWYEGEIKFKRPLFYTDSNKPIFSDINIKYILKGHGFQFSSIGKPVIDVMKKFNELYSSTKILTNWDTKLDFIVEDSETESMNEEVADEKRGKTNKRTLFFESNYISNIYAAPSIKIIYKHDNLNNKREEDQIYKFQKETKNNIYTPSFIIEEKINNFFGGNFTCKIQIDLLFKDEAITRESSNENFSNQFGEFLNEKEKRQKGYTNIDVNYQNKYFFFKPSIRIGSHEIVETKGKSNLNDTVLLNDVRGNFHFPLHYNKEFKFVEREKKSTLNAGLKEIFFLSPNLGLKLNYSENNFKDYNEKERSLLKNFLRSKNTRSSFSNSLNFPFILRKNNSLKYLKSLHLNYSRTFYFQEIDIPYEGEGISAFDEKYGVRRVYNEYANTTINLFEYPPWYFFTGRQNFAKGRDYTFESLNAKPDNGNGSPIDNYNNDLRLIENAELSSMFNFDIFVLNMDGGINHVCQRQSIYGIPQQVISLNINTSVNFDLTQLFSFGFFRSNKIGIPHHSANMNIGYDFARNMLITSNIEENSHIQGIGLTFKRDRSSLGLKIEINYRQRKKREYISLNEARRSRKDDIYISNIQSMESFKETDKSFAFSALFETDVLWLHNIFINIYSLTSFPIFSIEYSLILNRYDYTKTASPEPYDQHLFTGKLTLDLHSNIQGGISGRWALERFRNRDNNDINREIRSYEMGINFSLLF